MRNAPPLGRLSVLLIILGVVMVALGLLVSTISWLITLGIIIGLVGLVGWLLLSGREQS